MRNLLIWLGIAAALAILLSLLFGVPYIYSILGVSALFVAGHFVIPDGDATGAGSNPGESQRVWSGSLLQLLVKLAVVTILLGLLLAYPDVTGFGA